MYQRGKFIRAHTRTDNETNPKSGGKIIYYGHSVDPTLLVAIESIAAEQSKGTTQTEVAVHQL